MADASCSATALLLAHLPLIHGTATKVPHLSESPRLHHHKQTASRKRCCLFMAAKPSRERTCARHITYACRFALFSCTQACDLSVRAGSAACRARHFRPPPPPVACRSLPHKRTASSLPCPYGEAHLVSTTKSTCDASAFLF